MQWRYGNSTTAVGVLLILMGLVFFAVTQGAFDLEWRTIWPIFPTITGVFLLLLASQTTDNTRRASLVLAGAIPFMVGLFFFTTTTGILPRNEMGRLWPIFPLIVGVAFFAAYFASGSQTKYYLIPGTILMLVGLVFGGILLSGASYGALGQVWPIFLIIAGVLLLFTNFRRGRSSEG
ncbi:MAG TPA: hypothetical protein VJ183_13850 [Chloroflexia bacterium]|nr:hypothetical protein [Chloroflexia bacterium]